MSFLDALMEFNITVYQASDGTFVNVMRDGVVVWKKGDAK